MSTQETVREPDFSAFLASSQRPVGHFVVDSIKELLLTKKVLPRDLPPETGIAFAPGQPRVVAKDEISPRWALSRSRGDGTYVWTGGGRPRSIHSCSA
jgi:hypothetical protein